MTHHKFLPGIERLPPYSAMNQAVIDYRHANDNPKLHHHKLTPKPPDATIPAPYPLKNFQLDGVYNAKQILLKHHGVIIADDMGLGKTIESIVLANNMPVTSVLIVVPANTIQQWYNQYYAWAGQFITVLKTKAQAKAYNAATTPHAICSYEMLDAIAQSKTEQIGIIIYDEIHKLRSRSAKMCLAARDLRDRAQYVVGLTGTLQWGFTRDLWNPLRVVFGYIFGNADQFDFTYCGAFINEHGGKENKGHTSSDGVDRSEELAIRLSYVSISRTRKDVAAELPSFERRVTRIPCTQKATIALHAFLRKELPYMNAIMSTTNEKTDYVLEILEGLPNAVIFTWTRVDVTMLSALIAKTGRKVYVITGSTSKPERMEIIRQAAEEKATIVATIDSIGVGTDGLQHVSSNIIFHSLSHSPKLHLQAEARAHRIGQVNPVVIHYIVMEDSADELVINVLAAKSNQDKSHTAAEDSSTFKSLGISDAGMQKVLDEWVKNATDDIADDTDDWSDNDDDEN